MLSAEKKSKHSVFSNQYHSRLKELLTSISNRNKSNNQKFKENSDDDFIDIILDADFDKKGKIVSIY